MTMQRLILAAFMLLAACSNEHDRPSGDVGPRPDAAADAGVDASEDASADAGALDGGPGLDASENDAGVPDELGLCSGDEVLVQYSLYPLGQLPALNDLEFANLSSNAEVVAVGEKNVRFSFCRDSTGDHALRAIVWQYFSMSSPTLYRYDDTISAPVEATIDIPQGRVWEVRLPPANILVSGLEAALSGSLDDLEIRLVHESGLLVLGHNGFVALAPGDVTASSIQYTSSRIVAGAFQPGDVFDNLPCPFSQGLLATAFDLDTAHFEVEACTFMGAGHTSGYVIHHLTVQDTNTALSSAEQAPFVYGTAAEVEAVMNYQWNHHNACDSFHLALPHADYAASAAPSAGCGATVPNAPERDFNEPHDNPTFYRIRYHGGAWVDGEMPGCRHYLFCNQ